MASSLLSIHGHRVFRGSFIVILLLHMLLLLVPWMEVPLPAPPMIRRLFSFASALWPFPTFIMVPHHSLFVRQLLMKSLEISVILLYTVDLLPKIFLWKQSFLWRSVNIIIVSLMVLQLPATLITFNEVAITTDRVKLRAFSISLCFVFLCEILSIREQRHLRIAAINESVKRQQQKKLKEYTWCEIVKHDRQGDCWVVIEDKVYDLSAFVDKHPGGPMIYDGAGGDCTAMWHSYHPSSMTKQPPPQQYVIGWVRDHEQFYSYDGQFYRQIKEEVEQYLPREKWQCHWPLFLKAGILVPLYFYILHWYVTQTTFISAVLLGCVAGQVGVNMMHDGNHGAFTSNKWISLIAGYGLDLTFSTSLVYRKSHNFGHHACVNHYELDRSFDTTYPLMRLHPLQPRLPMHRYQHFYIWIVYGLANFGDLFGTFDEMRWYSNYPCRRGHLTKTQLIMQATVKTVWLILSLIIPSYLHGWFSIFPIWFTYMVFHSYNYTFFFAVNHWTIEAGVVDNSNIGQTNWGELQVVNSSNFALGSVFWTNLVGGLNYQIEHHLFPQIAHTRLPEISKIVQRVTQEYKIRYFAFNSFWDAIRSHYRLLKILGQQDNL